MSDNVSMEKKSILKDNIEVVNPRIDRGLIRFALFDFDGTVSLIREGWQGIMIPMMVEILEQTPDHEDRTTLEKVVTDYVTRLTGKQTIYQMMQLCSEITVRGGKAEDPLAYKAQYNDQLNEHIKNRIQALKGREVDPELMMVPGALVWLRSLAKRGAARWN